MVMPQTGSRVVAAVIGVSSCFVMAAGSSVEAPSCTCGITVAGRGCGIGVGRHPRSRLALVTTDSDEKAIAAAAMIGERRIPKNGYNTPAATGMPTAL